MSVPDQVRRDQISRRCSCRLSHNSTTTSTGVYTPASCSKKRTSPAIRFVMH
ncbi:hypothetical protein [Synechococcus sp. A18-25c]|uniref:hypothetical protein n=1 Tax=Synechococcus sp. A18-25c TaxID=1866938 RepID=UPI001649524E|nr:hypothetical protein [Synechococcus sp. A18-25c]